MTNENQVSNRVFLLGTVVSEPILSHETYGEGFYDFSVKVPRLSEQCDYIPITAAERLIGNHSIKIGSTVAIDGQFRSYNKVVENHSKLMLTVFAKEFLAVSEYFANPNSVQLLGYICKQPIYRTTPFNREICDLLIAVNRAFNKSDYLPCIAWGRNARFCRNLPVGTKVSVTGRIQSREYAKKINENVLETRTAYEISVCKIDTILQTDISIDNYEDEDD